MIFDVGLDDEPPTYLRGAKHDWEGARELRRQLQAALEARRGRDRDRGSERWKEAIAPARARRMSSPMPSRAAPLLARLACGKGSLKEVYCPSPGPKGQ
jgi:hypothetical protein